MIPKVIHYCWFGRGPKPELVQRCLESWKQHCPDYEIVEWNEERFDVNTVPYVKEAYEHKKFAFVTDYVRLYALYHHGGIYMDTDVQVQKSLDPYLKHRAFSGFENDHQISTGIMASEKGLPLFEQLLHYYDDVRFCRPDGSLDMTTNVETITNMLRPMGLVPNGQYQEVEGLALYPQNVFCPDHHRLEDAQYMQDTATIHFFAGSWKSEKARKRENSWYWNHIVVPLSAISRGVESVVGEPYTELKNRIRDKILK